MAGELQLGGSTVATHTGSGASAVVTIDSGVKFPAGHVIQLVPTNVSVEGNNITTSYVNYYEVQITLKSSSSNVLILHQFNYWVSASSGFGQKIYRSSSSPVTTSDTVVFDHNSIDGTGPLGWYGSSMASTNTTHAVDIVTGHNSGETLFYGFFYKERSGTAQVPSINTGANGCFATTLIEVQK